MSGERLRMGIAGLDDMMGGGLLKQSVCALIGTYGTGKTTFALQFLREGLERGENCIYISLEEREDRLLEYIAQKGWDVTQFLNK